MRLWTRGALGGGLTLLLLFGLMAVAFAHAELVGADPADGAVLDAPPERVRLFFSEPIEPEFYALQVYAADRGRVDRGDARISPTDARTLEVGLRDVSAGTYTVVWRALSLDGHVVRGSFAYTVGAGAAPGRPLELALPAEGAPFPLESAARWLTFLTAFVLLGGFAFRPLALVPALRMVGLEGSGVEAAARRRWLWVAWLALALLLAASFAALLFQAASAAGVPLADVLGGRAVTRLLTATRYGGMWLVRIGLLVGMVGVLAWLGVASTGGSRLWWAGVVLSTGVLLTISASGHASAVQDGPTLAVLADWAHLLAGGLWVGGLVQLGLTLPPALLAADGAGRRRLLGCLIPRFSWIASLSVGVLALSGLYAGLLHVPSWASLLDTSYGAALFGKLLVFLPLLALGAINLFVMHPRFRRAVAETRTSPADAGGRRIFRLLVLGEIALATAVLAVTGALTGLPPATSLGLDAKPFAETQRTATEVVTLTVRPNQAGENRIEVTLADQRGAPSPDAERVRLTLTMLDMEMGPREVEARWVDPGRYELEGNHLSMVGRWQADVTVRRAGAEEQVSFAFAVGQAPGANRPAFSPGRIAMLAANGRSFLAMVALGGAALVLARRGGVRSPSTRRQARAAAAALLIVGLSVGGASVADAYRRSLGNPVTADAASLARGQETYQAACASCHGVSGRGDGPAGRVLRPRPADFRAHMAAGHTDQELFEWVTNGVQGTAMPAFEGQLSEQERWDVINYIRTFAAQP